MGKVATHSIEENPTGATTSQVTSLRRPSSDQDVRKSAIQAGNARLGAANAAWNKMTVDQADAWNAYAETITRHNPQTGEAYHPTGKNTLVALTSKFLQVNPGMAVPLKPPTKIFIAPPVAISVAGVAGKAIFSASATTGTNAVVELLIQPLTAPRRSPTQFYKSAAFVSFPQGRLRRFLNLEPGWYAAAYRFVDPQTGQMSPMTPLGKIEVL